eukprot:TRINITY_DN6444_c0_g1_i1.p1 TRINITY_DN6444_c0_g1~~TRINITY_DN6444_c0_g1_i1.p1  ORF type:complete len:111 (+),score=17.69 TRINITY_DN6444_c0_g1_i1:643-975(+)
MKESKFIRGSFNIQTDSAIIVLLKSAYKIVLFFFFFLFFSFFAYIFILDIFTYLATLLKSRFFTISLYSISFIHTVDRTPFVSFCDYAALIFPRLYPFFLFLFLFLFLFC